MEQYIRILGGLLGAAVGDALGAATESRSRLQIKRKFGGYVTDFITPPDDVYAAGFPKGSVTDDFSLAYYTALAIINHNGVVDKACAEEALICWAQTPYFKLAGRRTADSVRRLMGDEIPESSSHVAVDNSRGTNGSAMKISPVGLASKGNINKAVNDAITICMPTHNNSTSLSAACAIAAAVSESFNANSSIDTMVRASLHGAQKGERFGRFMDKELACPSVYKRISLAYSIARKHDGNMEKTMEELGDIIGSGISAAEAVPTAIGLFVAGNGNPREVITAAANIGNDTDTVATIAGALAGCYTGVDPYLYDKLQILNEVNGFDLEKLARELERL